MYNKGSTLAIIKIDGNKVRSCSTIQNFADIPKNIRPQIPLQADIVKDTKWEEAKKEIALVILPTLAPLPFGTDINSTVLNEDFINEMQKISDEHGLWARMVVYAYKQHELNFETTSIVRNLMASSASSKSHDHCQESTKGFQNATLTASGPITKTSLPGKKHENKQNIIKHFFHCNPTPACILTPTGDAPTFAANKFTQQIPPHSSTAPTISFAAAPPIGNSPTDFYTQFLKTFKTLQQAPPLQQKIVVQSRKHEESVHLAKLQMTMLKLFYATGDIDWEEGTVKNIHLATFAPGFNNLLGRTATNQEAQFTNLFNTVFITKPDEYDNNLANPLK